MSGDKCTRCDHWLFSHEYADETETIVRCTKCSCRYFAEESQEQPKFHEMVANSARKLREADINKRGVTMSRTNEELQESISSTLCDHASSIPVLTQPERTYAGLSAEEKKTVMDNVMRNEMIKNDPEAVFGNVQLAESPAMERPIPESSVEISQNSKGEARVTVKVYHGNVYEARRMAINAYKEALAGLL